MQPQSRQIPDYSIWISPDAPPPDLGSEADFYIHQVPDDHRLFFKGRRGWTMWYGEVKTKEEAHTIAHPFIPEALAFVGDKNVRWLSSWQVYKNERRNHERNIHAERDRHKRLFNVCEYLSNYHPSVTKNPKERRNARERNRRRQSGRWVSSASVNRSSPKIEEYSDSPPSSLMGSDFDDRAMDFDSQPCESLVGPVPRTRLSPTLASSSRLGPCISRRRDSNAMGTSSPLTQGDTRLFGRNEVYQPPSTCGDPGWPPIASSSCRSSWHPPTAIVDHGFTPTPPPEPDHRRHQGAFDPYPLQTSERHIVPLRPRPWEL
jgi:hypothetical protein